jgi:hypothetical protein
MMDMTVIDMAMPDLVPPPDQAMQPTTVSCGSAECDQNNGQICCVTGMQGSFMSSCGTASACTTSMGNAFACDGPEDCPSTKSNCCVTVSGMLGNQDAGTTTNGSGGASCTGMCPASATTDGNGGFTAHSKLCHYRSDCKGYSGTAPIIGTTAFDLCCSSPMFGTYSFCFPSAAMNFVQNLTCN